MIYGMARNGQLPGSRFLTRLSPRTDEPLAAIVVAVILSLIPLIFIKRVDVLVAAITGMIIVPYILVLGSLLVRRLQGWPKTESKFNLRRWGLPVTVVALAWTIFVLIDAAWPRAATNPNLGSLPVIEYLGLGVLVVGVVWWFVACGPSRALITRRRMRCRSSQTDINHRRADHRPDGPPDRMGPNAMNFDAALDIIGGLDGEGFALGERAPTAPDFPLPEYRRRYQRLAALMEDSGFEALILTQEEAVRYLSGYNSVVWAVGRWLPTVLVVTRDPGDATCSGRCSTAAARRARPGPRPSATPTWSRCPGWSPGTWRSSGWRRGRSASSTGPAAS